jgi:hypothetical protein
MEGPPAADKRSANLRQRHQRTEDSPIVRPTKICQFLAGLQARHAASCEASIGTESRPLCWRCALDVGRFVRDLYLNSRRR